MGSLDTLSNSRYKAVYVDGVKQNNVYFIKGPFLEMILTEYSWPDFRTIRSCPND